MLSRSWAALAVLTLACAANTPPRPGDYLDDDSMIRRGRVALADAPATRACADSAAEQPEVDGALARRASDQRCSAVRIRSATLLAVALASAST
jgi:hypothetical protein